MKCSLRLLALALLCAPQLRADEAIQSYQATLLGIEPGTAGYTFQPLTELFVTNLGCFSYLITNQSAVSVGLWSSGGTLLASASVTTNDALVNASRYAPITTLMLSPGQTYYIGAFAPAGTISGDVVSPPDGGLAVTAPQLQLGLMAFSTNSIFEFPVLTQGSPGSGFMGPNFEFGSVPEPSSLALGCAGAGVLVAISRRRRKARVRGN